MRVVIDARLYGLQHRGLGRYLYELIPQLAAQDQATEYILLVDPKATLPKLPVNFRTVPAPWRAYSWGEQVKLPALIRRLKPDLIHYPHFTVPLLSPRPYVVTIHDLILHHYPSERATTLPKPLYWFKVAIYRLVFAQAVARAARVITVSQAVAQDLLHYYPRAQSKVTVVPLAPGSMNTAGVPLKLPPEYVLTVGAAYPHKNLELALKAMLLLKATKPQLKLIVVGRRDIFMERLESLCHQLGLSEQVVFWGQASEPELVTLYRETQAYLVPSFIEGFGLGAVEALTHGTPVVAADIPVLREVLGQAAVFIDPKEPSSLAGAIIRVLNSGERDVLAQAGAAVLKRLSWSETARATRAVYSAAV